MKGADYCYNNTYVDRSVKMADKKQSLSIEDVDDVAGGTVTVSVDKTKLRKIAIDAKHNGKTLDWVLQYYPGRHGFLSSPLLCRGQHSF